MTSAIGAILGGLGLACLLLRRNLLGVYVGFQLVYLGGSVYVVSMARLTDQVDMDVFGLFAILAALLQLSVGFAVAIRVFYLKKATQLDQLRGLKH